MSLPLTPYKGNPPSHVERKDGKVKLYESNFSQQQWKEIEKVLGKSKNFFFIIVAIGVVVLLFLFIFFWSRKEKKLNYGKNRKNN